RGFEYVALMPTSLYGYAHSLQSGEAEPVQIESAPVSHDFFRVLGVSPVLGRDFAATDERVNAAPVVIVSDKVWREQLNRDPHAAGRTIQLDGRGYTVIGVMGPDVEFPRGAGLWTPLGIEARIVERRGATFLQAIARLKAGQSGDAVITEIKALLARLAGEHPEVYSQSQRAVVTPLVEYWTGSARAHLWIMLGAALLLLIASSISCGILLLSRTLSRRHELAARVALGASQGQILGQLAVEGAAIAAIAAAAGFGIAAVAVRFLTTLAPADIPRLQEATLNAHAFWFATAAASVAAMASSMLPGLAAVRMRVEPALREGGARLSRSRHGARMRGTFILAQAMVTVTLLAVASLMVLSYRSMMSADTGFSNRDTVSMNLQLRGREVDLKVRRSFYRNLLDRLRESPGVTSAAAVLVRPLEGTIGWDVSYDFDFEAGRTANRVLPKANYEVVTPGYFKTVGTPVLEGRDFDEHDAEEGAPVAIISQALAAVIRKAGHSPVGYRIQLGLGGWKRIIGVSGDARYRGITQTGVDVFVPFLQAAQATNYVVIRGTKSAKDLTATVRGALAAIDPNQTVAGVATLGELINRDGARHRFNMILLVWFGVCAGILAASGIYSVIAETTAEREVEIAIKKALGAGKSRLVSDMVTVALGLVAVGEGMGALCAVWAGTAASDLLYGVSPRDPRILASICAGLFIVSAAAGLWPAWVAARQDSSGTLRTS
ncbi:MAG TPA: ABC transporter permease, partial [Bryobacteraceae bacterium]|nr:ABC transporter permease [Bryobacteraceae bacterium]